MGSLQMTAPLAANTNGGQPRGLTVRRPHRASGSAVRLAGRLAGGEKSAERAAWRPAGWRDKDRSGRESRSRSGSKSEAEHGVDQTHCAARSREPASADISSRLIAQGGRHESGEQSRLSWS